MKSIKQHFKYQNIIRYIIGTSLLGTGIIYYEHQELINWPKLMFTGLIRQLWLVSCGIKMVNVYYNPYYNDLSKSEKH